jgi:hypothetical protein
MSAPISPTSHATIAQRKFIHQVLTQAGTDLSRAHAERVNRFGLHHTGTLAAGPTHKVEPAGTEGARLTITHPIYQRFLDMKKHAGKRKRAYPIHNRVLFGYLNTIITELRYGYTNEIRRHFETETTTQIHL